jgi:uncharacterized membrane protein YheB (UPF0754 family)
MSLEFIIFPLIGAAIGALTNKIAIRMLFRPYEPIFVGGRQLPLTPGLIPQNRHQIARNIAETFEKNLLSGDDIHRVITGPGSYAKIECKVEEMFEFLGPFSSMAAPFKEKIVEKIIEGLEEAVTAAVSGEGELAIAHMIEQKINAMDIETLEQLVLGFSGKQFQHITIFGGILGALIGVIQAVISVTF